MELQTQIDELKASSKRQKIAIIALAGVIIALASVIVAGVGDATFDTITCKAWKVVDEDGKMRINAGTTAAGHAGVAWLDKDGKVRIVAGTLADWASRSAVERQGRQVAH